MLALLGVDWMRTRTIAIACALGLVPLVARAAGPTVAFTLPVENATPAVFGSLPFPNDLYFDQGQPGDGDGTLLNAGLPSGAKMGLAAAVAPLNAAVVEDALDALDGFGTTSAVYFFLDGPLDPASLPVSPVIAPSLADSVFCADTASGTPVPITLALNVDSRIPNVLAVQPLSGRPLLPHTRYACVVKASVTGGGEPVEPSADWLSVRDGASANTDADAIYDPAVATLAGLGVPAAAIAGMTVFTTESTFDDLAAIHDFVLPAEPMPSADFTSRTELVFDNPIKLNALFGSTPHAHIAKVATGYFAAPRFQTPDPDGDGPLADLPLPPTFATCLTPCETTDESFTRDGSGRPVVADTPQIPFTVVVPSGTPPPGGWPVMIHQHGLGGQRDVVVRLADEAAAHGIASIGIDAVAHGYRFFHCTPAVPCSQDTANDFGGTAVPDGIADGPYLGFDLRTITANLGFLEAFHNFLAARDNLRQTTADLFSLVRLIQGHSVDAALGAPLDAGHVFFMGHSLGAMVGTGFVALEPTIQAAVLDAGGGDFVTRLFLGSPLGGGSIGLAGGVLGLDPANPVGPYAIAFNLAQTVIDPADASNVGALLLGPPAGAPRNVIQVESMDDEEIPNPSAEALAVAAGLPLFDPFVRNLTAHPLARAVVGTQRTVRGNVAAGTTTAALVQTGFSVPDGQMGPHAMTLVPGFPHDDELAATGELYPTLRRPVRVRDSGVLAASLAWFQDVTANGVPGTFTLAGTPSFNPVENADVPAGASFQHFFDRTVGLGGALEGPESTPDITVSFNANLVPSRVTVTRDVVGTTAAASDADVPPGPQSTVGTLGILPFTVTLQREIPGDFAADMIISYTVPELAIAGIPPATANEAALVVAAFQPGTCAVGGATCSETADCGVSGGDCLGATYTPLPTSVNTVTHQAMVTGVTAEGTLAILHPEVLAAGYHPPLVAGGAGQVSDCRGEWQIVNVMNTPFFDRKGRVNKIETCHDGDVACDADRTVNGTCIFRIGVCFNYPDPVLPLCTVGDDTISGYSLTRPKPNARTPVDATNAQRLLAALTAIGGTPSPLKPTTILYTPPFSVGRCTTLQPFQVDIKPKKHPSGRQNVRGISTFGSGALDAGGDLLKLRCYPPA